MNLSLKFLESENVLTNTQNLVLRSIYFSYAYCTAVVQLNLRSADCNS